MIRARQYSLSELLVRGILIMWIIWDVIAVAIILIFVHSGTKKGFIRSLIAVLCYFVAMYAARYAAPKAGISLYDNVIAKEITRIVSENVEAAISQGTVSLDNIINQLPAWVAAALSLEYGANGIDISLDNSTGALSESITTKIVNSVSGIIIEFMTLALFLIFFSVFAIILKQAVKLFSGINRIPVVGTVNMFFGGFFGAIELVIVLILICIVVNMISDITFNTYPFISKDILNQSFIMGKICKYILKI